MAAIDGAGAAMTSPVIVVTEFAAGRIKPSSVEALSLAHRVAGDAGVVACVFGASDETSALVDLGRWGVREALLAPVAAELFPARLVRVLASWATEVGARSVLLASGQIAADIGPQLAARLNGVWIQDCCELTVESSSDLTLLRPVYFGRLFERLSANTAQQPLVIGLRANAFPAATPSAGNCRARPWPAPAATDFGCVLQQVRNTGTGPRSQELSAARVVVAGGSAMGSAANFQILEELAEVLGGVVAASRGAVDLCYAPHARQIGQTGKTVSPVLFVACGISGAPQHLAGMRTSQYIVAINKDPHAPIFRHADIGWVGDLFTAVPLLTARLRNA